MFKRVFLTIIVGAAGFAAWQAAHPTPVSADAATEEVQAENTASLTGRAKYRIGSIGAGMVGGQVRASLAKTERERVELEPLIKKTGGRNGTNAKIVSKKIIALESASVASLEAAHPIDAMKRAFEAKRFIDILRQDVSDETAAR